VSVRADLHTHSNLSDGTTSPSQLVHAAAAAGLDVVALTDHDTTAGWSEASAAAAEVGIGFVPGMEISTRTPDQYGDRVPVHLLAYWFDPDDAALCAEAERARRSRAERARAMTELVAADYLITWEQVRAQVRDGATVGRPHIAGALVAAGHATDRPDAFARILRDPRYRVHHYATDTATAIALVGAAGGVPVIAHPGAGRGYTITETMLRAFVDAGLAGIEVDHRENPPPVRARLRAFAAAHDLIVTGSSDYHGTGKPNRLGEHLTDPGALDRITAAALSGRASVVRSGRDRQARHRQGEYVPAARARRDAVRHL